MSKKRSYNRYISMLITIAMIMVFFLGTSICSYGTSNAPSPTTASSSVGTVKFPKIKAKGYIVMDASTGYILCGRKQNDRFYPASTTKILTTILGVENGNLTDVVTVSQNALTGQENGGTHIGLKKGEKLTLQDLLYGTILESGNDAAIAIAEHISGNVSNFAALMNSKAKELGLSGSHFVNPNGMFNANHYTTPADLANITRYAVKNPTFLKIFGTTTYKIKKTNKSKKRILWHSHKMLPNKSYAYPGVLGGKSGFVGESKFNLVTYAKRGNVGLIAVVMRGKSAFNDAKDTTKLFNYYFNNYTSLTVKGTDTGISNLDLLGNTEEVSVEGDMQLLVPKGVTADQITYKSQAASTLEKPIKAGTVVGQVDAVYNGQVVGRASLTAAKDINFDPGKTTSQNFFMIVSLVLALVIIIALFLFFKKMRKRNKAYMRNQNNIKRKNNAMYTKNRKF